MLPAGHPVQRAVWGAANQSPTTTTSSVTHHCSPFTLPYNGVISINPTSTITLTADAIFTPECTANSDGVLTFSGGPQSIQDMRDPFNTSVPVQVYATAAATVIAWMLVVMLIITPRTFFVGGAGGTSGLLGRRGMISGASGGNSVIGVGSRPWLQKAAALTVAISLTIATADTFRVAESQYRQGFMDGQELRDEVVGGLEIKISRVISDIFLWLAQVQTLIRLFSRHKEKVIIKWTGFALIVLDMTFSILNNFLIDHDGRPQHFVDAIPALNYVFQCALSMLYAAWVIYYSLTKRRYAFYHKLMPNIGVVAILSIIAILTPLVFFITDISNYDVAGWGDYFRWVGAAAASVIVWEWVERIEALERDEKKDGILGREIFDGDDMLENTPHQEVSWPSHRHDHGGRRSGGGGHASALHGTGLTHRFARRSQHLERTIMVPLGRVHSRSTDARGTLTSPSLTMTPGYPHSHSPPQPVASPASRTDTTSATSTVYTIRYHTINEPLTPRPMQMSVPPQDPRRRTSQEMNNHTSEIIFEKEVSADPTKELDTESQALTTRSRWKWPGLSSPFNPFKRRVIEPPTEVLGGRVVENVEKQEAPSQPEKPQPPEFGRWDLKGRLGAFAAEQTEKLRERASGKPVEMMLPVTIIPAQPRGRTWSPNYLANQGQREAQGTILDESSTAVPPPPSETTAAEDDHPRHQNSVNFAEQRNHPRHSQAMNVPTPLGPAPPERTGENNSPFSPPLSPAPPDAQAISSQTPSPSQPRILDARSSPDTAQSNHQNDSR